MKYCSHCGNEVVDEAVVCPKCGCQVYSKETFSDSDSETLTTVAKVFMILGCVSGAICYLIPLIWCIPMTVHYFNAIKRGEKLSTGFKVCSLLFASLVAGIVMLCDKKH